MGAYARLPRRPRIVVGWFVVAASAALFEAVTSNRVSRIPYYSPLNFIVYVPLAYWLASLRPSARPSASRFWPALALVYLALAFQDVTVHNVSVYGRPSLVVGALVMSMAALAARPRPAPRAELVGRYSLGIFAIHKYAWYVVARSVALSGLSLPRRAGELLPCLVALCAVFLTGIAVWLVAASPARALVTEGRRPERVAIPRQVTMR